MHSHLIKINDKIRGNCVRIYWGMCSCFFFLLLHWSLIHSQVSQKRNVVLSLHNKNNVPIWIKVSETDKEKVSPEETRPTIWGTSRLRALLDFRGWKAAQVFADRTFDEDRDLFWRDGRGPLTQNSCCSMVVLWLLNCTKPRFLTIDVVVDRR